MADGSMDEWMDIDIYLNLNEPILYLCVVRWGGGGGGLLGFLLVCRDGWFFWGYI